VTNAATVTTMASATRIRRMRATFLITRRSTGERSIFDQVLPPTRWPAVRPRGR
jgi:hypothetical protein